MSLNEAGPPQEVDRGAAKRRAQAQLWSGVWEVSQFLSYDEIREFVEGTIHEIEIDAP